MSVKVADRSDSRAQFIETARKVNVRIGQIVVNGPKKYSALYGRPLVQSAFDLYRECVMANRIYLKRGRNLAGDYRLRRDHLMNAKGMVTAVSAQSKVYFDLMLNGSGFSYPREGDAALTREQQRARRASERAIGRMHDVGKLLAEEDRLLSGVIGRDYSDAVRWGL